MSQEKHWGKEPIIGCAPPVKSADLTDRERVCWEQHWSGKVQWLLSYEDAVRYLTAERQLQEAEAENRRLRHALAMHTKTTAWGAS